MAEQSPLAGVPAIVGPRLVLIEMPLRAKVTVRGRDADPALVAGVTAALGAAPPLAPNRTTPAGTRTLLWLGPGEWRVIGPPGDQAAILAALQSAVPRRLAAVTDVSDGYTTLRLSGAGARDLLAEGCPLDLHPRVFAVGDCAQSLLAKTDILLHQVDATPTFDLQVRWSHAAYLWAWLAEAAAAAQADAITAANTRR
jgi:sarcosine oxidase subunit gamma